MRERKTCVRGRGTCVRGRGCLRERESERFLFFLYNFSRVLCQEEEWQEEGRQKVFEIHPLIWY